MTKKQGQAIQQVQETVAVSDELALLKGFRDLVHEGLGYYFGAKAVQSDASEKTKDQRKAASTIRKDISTHIEEWIKNADVTAYTEKMTALKEARKVVSEATKPFNEKKNPLSRAWKYCVSVALPDSLKELGTPVQPTFNLSNWIAEAIKPKKKNQ